MMQREFAAIVLCIATHAAAAQCVAPAGSAATLPVAASESVRAAGTPAIKQPLARAELIQTASAGTRDDAPPAMTARPRVNGQQDHPRRGGTAMLLAALALMSGIALRRYGAPRS